MHSRNLNIRRTLSRFCLVALAAGCGKMDERDRPVEDPQVAHDLTHIRQRDTLVAIMASNSTSYFLYRGEPLGYEYEMLQRFAKDQGIALKVVPVKTPDQALTMLNRGQGDVVAARLFPTQEWRGIVSYTRPIHRSDVVVVQRGSPPGAGVQTEAVERVLPESKGALGFRLASYEEHGPVWTHDGKRLIFASSSEGNYEVFSVNPDGSDLQRLTENSGVDWRVTTAPDGPQIAFERLTGAGDADVVVALNNGSEPRTLKSAMALELPVREGMPRLLRNGSQVLYTRGGVHLDEGIGETLAIMDATTGGHILDLVQPMKNHEIIYTLAPDGQRIAYHQHGRWKCNNSSIVVIDTRGAVLQTFGLGVDMDIEDLYRALCRGFLDQLFQAVDEMAPTSGGD